MNGDDGLTSVSMESCEGDVALEVEGESRRDSELLLTFIHSITVVPVAVLEPDRDLRKSKEDKSREGGHCIYLTSRIQRKLHKK